MKRQLTILAFAACLSATGLYAEETSCTGALSGSFDNVVVPQNAVCDLKNAFLNGSLRVERGAGVLISGRTYINANVLSEEGGAYVRILGPGVFVGGNVQIRNNFQASAILRGALVQGSIQYIENSGPLFASGVFVGSDFQVFSNTGGVSLTNNTIRQNLQCKENTPAPVGSGNKAGDKQDQCAAL